MREAPWIAVPQVVTAIRILERLVGPAGLLFPTDRGTRPGRSLSFPTMATRIEEFIGWVNERTARPGQEDTIPADPHGHIGTSRFRRTLAWHIARLPGGLVALAVQYGHLRTLVSQGYSSRQRDGIHQLLDLETARAVAEHLSEVHDALHHGEGVSGPAARRLIHAAREEHHRFGGILTTPRQAKALLSDPALTVFENADAYLICNYDPSRALCNPDNAADGLASTPSLDRCQPTCPNIARTDSHAQQIRTLAERLRDEADAALTPQPVADRLRHRATALADFRQARPHPHRTHRRGISMTTDRERGQISAAMDRLLAGTPLRSDGALTVVSLAVEADVKRHVLTHRHTDLKDEFYARVRAQGHVPASEQELRDELKTTKQKLAEAREENRQLKASVEAFARIVNILTAENDRLTRQQSEPGNRTLIPLRPGTN